VSAVDPATTKTAPRRRLSADQRRRQLIDAAVTVVARRGYATASVAAIAEQAGVAEGLLFAPT
jgi:AcrR family transcriptional regulator